MSEVKSEVEAAVAEIDGVCIKEDYQNGKDPIGIPVVENRYRSRNWNKDVNRKVVVAVDHSQHSRVAFHCEFLCCFKIN